MMGEILVGITSWTEPTLIKSGRFYPEWARSSEAYLRYYASQFPIVEVDSSYYALLNESTSGLWVNRTPENFLFDIKAFRLFTLHPTPLTALPGDIRQALPPRLSPNKTLYCRDLPGELADELWCRFEQALIPLDSAAKLGVVLFQFPPWFYPGEEQRRYIAACQEKLPQFRLAIEFRHTSWMNEKNLEHTLAFLRQRNLAYVCCDEPQGFESSVPPLAEATSDISVIRLHGRNTETWEKKGISVVERFNYLYAEEELEEWLPKIEYLASRTRQLHILFNNCYADKAVVNARQVKLMLD
jgi:uncharacterized protein YecE (DUF72 family)